MSQFAEYARPKNAQISNRIAVMINKFAVMNNNSCELLSDWVDRSVAESLAKECEKHESEPEVRVVSYTDWSERFIRSKFDEN